MAEPNLQGRRILVVEDEYYLADELSALLAEAGAEIVGPVPSVAAARVMVDSGEAIDAALLDVNLRGEMIFDVADALRARDVPFAFATGYDRSALPARFAEARRIEKPVQPQAVIAALAPLVAEGAPRRA